jgi:hypothetical protein
VGPRAGLDDMEKRTFLTLPGLELPPLGRPARSQSLYRLRYPGSHGIWLHAELSCLLVSAVLNLWAHALFLFFLCISFLFLSVLRPPALTIAAADELCTLHGEPSLSGLARNLDRRTRNLLLQTT